MKNKKPRGYFKHLLALDVETSGLAFKSDDPSIEPDGKEYQIVSAGLVVADADTLKPVEKLYVEVKWDGKSIWNDRAQQVHGLSKAYLEENGLTNEDAALAIGNLIIKYWGVELVAVIMVCSKYHVFQLFSSNTFPLRFEK